MSNIIEKCIREAGLEWCTQTEQDRQNIEHFVKLIIGECNLAINKDYITHYATHYQNYKHTPADCEDAINKHFEFSEWK